MSFFSEVGKTPNQTECSFHSTPLRPSVCNGFSSSLLPQLLLFQQNFCSVAMNT